MMMIWEFLYLYYISVAKCLHSYTVKTLPQDSNMLRWQKKNKRINRTNIEVTPTVKVVISFT